MEADSNSRVRRLVRQQLRSLLGCGISFLPRLSLESTGEADTPSANSPVPVVEAPPTRSTGPQEAPSAAGKRVSASLFDTGRSSTAAENEAVEAPLSREERERRLEALKKRVAACRRCAELAETRTQTVFGVGDPEARIMFIGEAPGADEDRQGEPFVGRAGQLLNRIIAACGMKREDVYICNVLKCRPPNNRNPLPEEAANCREYLDAQIELVDPEYIVCWGAVAAQNLLDTTAPIGRLRGKFYEYGRAKVLCTYHPSYLLRNPAAKKPVWEDMKFLFRDMGIELRP